MDVSLILYAEHEFNASTFTARVCASTMSDIHSCVVAAIGSLRGPLHGGANEKAMELIENWTSKEEAKSNIIEMLGRKEKIMGFGHAVYSIKDPRNAVIKEYAKENDKSAVVLAPSNPFVSIDPILNVPTMTEELVGMKGPKIAISPIINSKAVKGPAAKMMQELGVPSTSIEIANHYKELIDAIVIDHADAALSAKIEDMGIKVFITNTVMHSLNEKITLANECINFVEAYWENRW